jgi:hypothetical protein
MEWLRDPVLFAVLGVVAVLILRWMLCRLGRAEEEFPYETVPLFTPTETRFLDVLEEALEPDYRIYGKVRLADLIKVIPGQDRAAWGRAFNRIKAKHIDYVLSDPSSRQVVCAIELDDPSHERPDRVARDAFVERALEVAGLPLLRIDTAPAYDCEELRRRVEAIAQELTDS